MIETRFSGRGHRRCGDGRRCREFKIRVNVWTVHRDTKRSCYRDVTENGVSVLKLQHSGDMPH